MNWELRVEFFVKRNALRHGCFDFRLGGVCSAFISWDQSWFGLQQLQEETIPQSWDVLGLGGFGNSHQMAKASLEGRSRQESNLKIN